MFFFIIFFFVYVLYEFIQLNVMICCDRIKRRSTNQLREKKKKTTFYQSGQIIIPIHFETMCCLYIFFSPFHGNFLIFFLPFSLRNMSIEGSICWGTPIRSYPRVRIDAALLSTYPIDIARLHHSTFRIEFIKIYYNVWNIHIYIYENSPYGKRDYTHWTVVRPTKVYIFNFPTHSAAKLSIISKFYIIVERVYPLSEYNYCVNWKKKNSCSTLQVHFIQTVIVVN